MMHSFLPTEQTACLVFFNLCLILLMYALMKKALRPPYIVAPINRVLTVLLMFVFVLFSFWGADWFHYLMKFSYLQMGDIGHMEEIYGWIARTFTPNYLIFRFILWGTSLFGLLHIFKRLSIPTYLAFFLFSSIYIIWFSYSRVSAAMVLTFYGLTLMYKPYKKKSLSILIGLIALVVSVFLHKTAIFGIFVSVLSIISFKYERKLFLLLLICYPILIIIAQFYLRSFLLTDLEGEDGGLEAGLARGQMYLNLETKDMGIGPTMQRLFERLPYFALAYLTLSFIRSKLYFNTPNNIKIFLKIQLLILLFSSLFMFNLGANTDVVYIRFLRYSIIPSCISLAYLYSIRYKFGLTRFVFYLSFCGTLYTLIYTTYCVYVKFGW